MVTLLIYYFLFVISALTAGLLIYKFLDKVLDIFHDIIQSQ